MDLPIDDGPPDVKPVMVDGRFDAEQSYGPRVDPPGKAKRLKQLEQDVDKLMELGFNMDKLDAAIADEVLKGKK